jgi:hypothetical protein
MPFMHRTAGILLFSLLFTAISRAQDTLPRFSATARGTGKILISWHNHYPTVSQISIQRSTDSLKNFTTLITVPDPTLPANGVTDSKAPHPNFYYRLFIVLDHGRYLFTPSRRPASNTGEPTVAAADDNDDKEAGSVKMENTRILYTDPAMDKGKPMVKPPPPSSTHGNLPAIEVNTTIFVRRGDKLLGQVAGGRLGTFRDSLLNHTRDTLVFIDGDTLLIKPFIPKEVYKISSYVFTGKYGNIQVSLPEAGRKHYAVKFFDENNKLLFELSEIKDPSLTIDKTNFQHAGWFHFELYEGDQLKEKNKLFIPKEF